ncbi:MAG TPA: thiamine pyrophosphate-dependent enzyme [Acidobacteriaceae bacterium]|nr:thiamine pyrophosphate-dependent enzyme [Acidobacteriaceae bacterium]
MAIQERSAVSSAAANGKHGHSLISDEKFHQLYTLALDLHFSAEQGAASRAEEDGALAGVAAGLLAGDVLVSEHAVSLSELGMGISGVRVMPPTSEGVIDALSAAVADRMRRTQRVTTIFASERASGPLLDAARTVASGARLPVIFVEQANECASSSRRVKTKAAEDELISIPVDAHDVIAVYRVAHESIMRARQGNGPTRIVCLSLSSPSNGSQTRRNDAVAKLEEWLIARDLPVGEWRQEIMAKREDRNRHEWKENSNREKIPQTAA